MEKTLEIVLEALEQTASEMESLRKEMTLIEKNYNDLQKKSLKNYSEAAEIARYDTARSNDTGVIETLARQITSPCMSCENAKLTVEIDDPTNLIFECLASVKTDKPVLACNKWTIAMDRDSSHE
nr:hypothetical protein [Vibrio parahaemolyticus]